MRDKLDGPHFPGNIFKCILWMKSFVFRFEFRWILLPGVQSIIIYINSGNSLAPDRHQTIAWTNSDPVYRRVYAALKKQFLFCVYLYKAAKWIHPSKKSHKPLAKYSTMHYFVIALFTQMHNLVRNGAMWHMGLVHCGNFATKARGRRSLFIGSEKEHAAHGWIVHDKLV